MKREKKRRSSSTHTHTLLLLIKREEVGGEYWSVCVYCILYSNLSLSLSLTHSNEFGILRTSFFSRRPFTQKTLLHSNYLKTMFYSVTLLFAIITITHATTELVALVPAGTPSSSNLKLQWVNVTYPESVSSANDVSLEIVESNEAKLIPDAWYDLNVGNGAQLTAKIFQETMYVLENDGGAPSQAGCCANVAQIDRLFRKIFHVQTRYDHSKCIECE